MKMKISYEGFPFKNTLKMISVFPFIYVIIKANRIAKDAMRDGVFHKYDQVHVIRFGWLLWTWKIEIEIRGEL